MNTFVKLPVGISEKETAQEVDELDIDEPLPIGFDETGRGVQ